MGQRVVFVAYLLAHRTAPAGGFDLRIEQGHALQRPSLILLRAAPDGQGRPRIRVGGSVVATLRGALA